MEKLLKTLEFNKIIDKFINFASTTLGKDLCKNLIPAFDFLTGSAVATFCSIGLPVGSNDSTGAEVGAAGSVVGVVGVGLGFGAAAGCAAD